MKRVVVRHVPEPATQSLQLQKGDADIARDLGADQVKSIGADKAIRVEDFPGANTWYIGLNTGHPALSNVKVRQAIKYAIDYQGMVNSFLKGQFFVQQTFLPIGFFAAIPYNPYKLDIAKAKALLAEAGFANGFDVKLSMGNSSPLTEIAQSIQQTLGQAGIRVQLMPAEKKAVLGEYRARKHDMALLSWGPDYLDPHTNADTFARNTDNSDTPATKPLAWRNKWFIPELSKKTAAAAQELDGKKREQMYAEMQKTVTDEGPFVIMFQNVNQIAERTNVKGFKPGITEDMNFYRLITKS